MHYAPCTMLYAKGSKFASVRRWRSLSGSKVLSSMHYALCTMHSAQGSKFASVRRRWRSGFEVCMPGILAQLTTHQLDLRDGRRLFREILNWDKSGCRACPAAEEKRKETNQNIRLYWSFRATTWHLWEWRDEPNFILISPANWFAFFQLMFFSHCKSGNIFHAQLRQIMPKFVVLHEANSGSNS